MADLLTLRELALWTKNPVDEVTADPFAAEVIDKVSQLAEFIAGQPGWVLDAGDDQAPFDVRMVVLQVCKRCYENTRQVVQEGGIGPIGGDSFLDVNALLAELTDAERATLAKYNEDGDPDGAQLWVLTTTRGDETIADTAVLYVGDNNQVGIDSSDDPREWKIPLFGPGDPGDPNLYPDEV